MNNPVTSAKPGLMPTLFANNPASLHTHPDSNPSVSANMKRRFKDILIVEERLRLNNATRMASRRMWMASLLLLAAVSLSTGYCLFAASYPETETLPTTVTNPLLLYSFFVSTAFIIAFFALGLYRSTIRDPQRFRPMVNNVLKHYCIEVHSNQKGEFIFSRKVPVSFAEGYSQYREKVRRM
ncbi:hypothetical protein HDU78_005019 [Chytriomyces hyalinus]|nr:hypothetical protein HDU78_005019 [Chytriomyces hyalinus]KAJ3265232.1 hypothetical protein HDU77_006087 [Chytriomyces hyalinus]